MNTPDACLVRKSFWICVLVSPITPFWTTRKLTRILVSVSLRETPPLIRCTVSKSFTVDNLRVGNVGHPSALQLGGNPVS